MGNIVVSQVSAVLINSPLKIPGTLALFTVICCILFLFIFLLLPETKVMAVTLGPIADHESVLLGIEFGEGG